MPLPTGQKNKTERSFSRHFAYRLFLSMQMLVEIMWYVYITSNGKDKLHNCHDLFLNSLRFIRMSELFYNVSEWGPGAVKLQKIS